MDNIVILGAGMAGFGAAHRLHIEGVRSTIYEKNSYHGGNAASFTTNGFLFDDGPHISFTKHQRLRKLFDQGISGEVEKFNAYVNNIWKEYKIKHPAQVNLHGLPKDLVVKIIQEFIALPNQDKKEITNYKDWLYASFGKTFSETFPMKYGLKFHTLPAEEMAIDWIGPRLYQADLEEVLKGAISAETDDVHYISEFFYPTNGGFVSFLKTFLPQTEINLQHKVIEIDPFNKTLQFSNGLTASYSHIISSIPLPELIPMIKGVPPEVVQASEKLSCSICLLVNLGVNRADISEAHWTYLYDEDIVFTRLSFPHKQSPNNVPDGCSSIQAEIYFSNKYKPLQKSPEEYIEPTIRDLIRCSILEPDDEILHSEAKLMPYANVIFDHDRAPNLSIVHSYLDKMGIKYCGRYGDWEYIWTDTSFISGEKAAQKILDQRES
jgi:protoporphyrinogen oxidase